MAAVVMFGINFASRRSATRELRLLENQFVVRMFRSLGLTFSRCLCLLCARKFLAWCHLGPCTAGSASAKSLTGSNVMRLPG